MNKKYPYVFSFKNGKEKLDYHGRIENYWNDIYDMFDSYRDMFAERLDGKEFTIKQIKYLFSILDENMSEDFAIIKISVITPYKLKFTNTGDIYRYIPELKNYSEGYAIKIINKKINELYSKNMSEAIHEFHQIKNALIYDRLYKEFGLKNPERMGNQKYKNLGFAIKKFLEFEKDKKYQLYNLYDIIEKLETDPKKSEILIRSGVSKKNLRRVKYICNGPNVKSRHSGKYKKPQYAS